MVIALLVQTVWSIIASLINFIVILLLIRLVIILASGSSFSGNPLLYQIDQTLSPLARRISRTFTGDRQVSYKAGLIITILALVALSFIGQLAFSLLAQFLAGLPV